jgi:hypothetical protein
VKALMKEQRKPRVKTEEKPRQSAQVGKPAHAAGSTIWRSLPDGGRYVQIPPIHDEEAGVTLQEMMEQGVNEVLRSNALLITKLAY